MVSVKVNGKQELLDINIDEEAITEGKEMLEDLIISAINKAISKSQTDSQENEFCNRRNDGWNENSRYVIEYFPERY